MKSIFTSCLFILFFALVGCAPSLSSNVYSADQVGVANKTATGVIVGKRLVEINNSNPHVGAMAGTVAGAAGGSAIGGGTRAHVIGGVGGAVVGGLLGNALDQKVNHQKGYEYLIRLTQGNTISITQTVDTNLPVGQSVLIIYGNPVRVIAQ